MTESGPAPATAPAGTARPVSATAPAPPPAPEPRPVPVVVAVGAGARAGGGGGNSAAARRGPGAAADSLVLPARPLGASLPEELPPALTPVQAFDALYEFAAPALLRQAYLLTGRRASAREAVEAAFRHAWEQWPEVARDPDPAGWVRAAAYDRALSPWHRFRPHRNPEPPPPEPEQRALLTALLRLPPPYRRTLVLYDGVGLDLPETAAETEASTPAAAGRLMRAREALRGPLPELADPLVLRERLAELASAGRPRASGPPAVRAASERRARVLTRAAIAFTAALIGTTALALRTAPTHYEPPVSPGAPVHGLPSRAAPGPLSDGQVELRHKLRDTWQGGPERLLPRAD
ncbi:sigma factor-like helix-turn-helix DNA-binding protein [Streptomyces sp. SID8352]|uniref:RNA polymerase sigma factor n=1 Tax=Streptomyces sp. SID8352 TaxID=2690338 RepID=UPI0031F68AB9